MKCLYILQSFINKHIFKGARSEKSPDRATGQSGEGKGAGGSVVLPAGQLLQAGGKQLAKLHQVLEGSACVHSQRYQGGKSYKCVLNCRK